MSRSIILLFACLLGLHVSSSMGQNLRVTVTDADGEPIADAVVEVLLPESLRAPYAAPAGLVIDQLDKEFVPTVSIIVAGSRISFPNSDDILHHVYSFSTINTFNIPLYGSSDNDDYVEEFTQPGVVEIGCNIHDWMLAYIYIADSSKVAKTNPQGVATIGGLPAGDYEIQIWHARLAASDNRLSRQISIATDGLTEASVSLELRRDRRLRRAPSANRKRYR